MEAEPPGTPGYRLGGAMVRRKERRRERERSRRRCGRIKKSFIKSNTV